MCLQHTREAYVPVYSQVAEHLRQDVREFWTRSSFFMFVEGGLFSVLVALGDSSPHGSVSARAAGFLPLIGGIIGLIWLWTTWWSVIWIVRWCRAFLRVEEVVDPLRCHWQAGFGMEGLSGIQASTAVIPLLFTVGWVYAAFDVPAFGQEVGPSTGVILVVVAILELAAFSAVWIRARHAYLAEYGPESLAWSKPVTGGWG